MSSFKKNMFRSMSGQNETPGSVKDRRRSSSVPSQPPSGALEHLSQEEMAAINQVFERHASFERTEGENLRDLQQKIHEMEETIRNNISSKNPLRQAATLHLCRICFKTKFVERIGRVCQECGERICSRCGMYIKDGRITDRQQKTKWRCRLCHLKREYACKSGHWYHGALVKPALDQDELWLARQLSKKSNTLNFGDRQDNNPPFRTASFSDITINNNGNRSQWNLKNIATVTSSIYRMASNYSIDDPDDGPSSSSNSLSNGDSTSRSSKSCSDSPARSQKAVERLSRSPARRTDNGSHIETNGACNNKGLNHTSSKTEPVGNQKVWRENDLRTCRPRCNGAPSKRTRSSLSISPLKRKDTRPRSLSADKTSIVFGNKEEKDFDPENCAILNTNITRQRAIRNKSPSRSNDVRNNNNNNNRPRQDEADNKSSNDGNNVDELLIVNNLNNLTTQAFGDFTQQTTERPKQKNSSLNGGQFRHDCDKTEYLRYNQLENDIQQSISASETDTDIQAASTLGTDNTSSISFPSDISCTTSIHKSIYCSSSSSLETSQHEKELTVQTDETMSSPRDIIIHQPPPEDDSPIASPSRRSRSSDGSLKTITHSPPQHLSSQQKSSPKRSDSAAASHRSASRENSSNSQKEQRLSHCCSSPSDGRQVITLTKDKTDENRRTNGFGMRVIGGKNGNNGRLGTFVVYVNPDGPAALQGIHLGDQILTWNGHSMVDRTFEEAQQVINVTGITVVTVTVIHQPRASSEQVTASDANSSRHSGSSRESTPKSEGSHRRRKLPKTPQELKRSSTKVTGKVHIQLWYSDESATLAVTVIQAQNLQSRHYEDHSVLPNTYAKIYLLPQRGQDDCFKTETVFMSSDPVWNQSYVFSDIIEEELFSHSLEISLWDYYPQKENSFLGEVHLKLCETNVQDVPKWHNLQIHNEKTAARVTQIVSLASLNLKNKNINNITAQETPKLYSGSKSETNSPAHTDSIMRRYKSFNVEDNQLLIEDAQIGQLSTDNIYKSTETEQINDVRNSFKAKKIRWKHAVSSALLKAFESKSVGGSVDSHRKPLGYLDKNISAVKNFTSLQNSPVKTTSYNFDVMAPPSLMSITSSQISGSWDGSIADDEVDRIASLKELSNGQHKCNDSTASLGPGQVKPAFPESKSKGELKMSLIVTKGHLEVEITSAKSLSASSPSPDGRRRVQKRKTKVIRGCSEPTFKQKLKYYARDIFGRRIEVSLWEKSSVFDKNHCLGAAEINLEDIDLSVQSAGWYQLHKTMNVMEYGSTNSLDN